MLTGSRPVPSGKTNDNPEWKEKGWFRSEMSGTVFSLAVWQIPVKGRGDKNRQSQLLFPAEKYGHQ